MANVGRFNMATMEDESARQEKYDQTLKDYGDKQKKRAARKKEIILEKEGNIVTPPSNPELADELRGKGYTIKKKKVKQKGGLTYNQQQKRFKSKIAKQKHLRAGVSRLTSFLVPNVGLPKSSYSSGGTSKRRVGRPRGPSGRYVIPGVGPVGVYKWRKWYRQQMSLERMERGRVPDYTEQEQDYNRNPYPEYTGQPEQRRLPQRPIRVERNDNILNAPNVARGELRNVGQRSALINVDDLNRPITNKGGDYYTEVDPVSGKQILRKRVREKWLS